MIFTCPNRCPLISIHSEIHQGQSQEEGGGQQVVLVSNDRDFLVLCFVYVYCNQYNY